MTVSSENMQFGKFLIPSSHIFYRTEFAAAFVNLRPIVPGHVLVCPHRVVPLLCQLTTEEYQDLWMSVRTVQEILGKHYKAAAFNVAVQDGAAAGQSVPHVHVHVLPRTEGDFQVNDQVYDELEDWAPREEFSMSKAKLDVPGDEDRKDRTEKEMAEEAAAYRTYL
jgi:bis(5'-adenosyl)-triphosphatase